LGIIHRINITRFSYHIAIGAYNIRDPLDQIEVRDETIEHMSVRIYRPRCRIPENLDLDESAIAAYVAPTILFYHGGGFFVGSAGNIFYPSNFELHGVMNILFLKQTPWNQ
jgi:acetyl esterase/lipase